MKDHISKLRTHYKGELLDKKNVSSNPTEQFKKWIEEAIEKNVPEANAMTLATVNKEATPSVRIVLLKDFDEKGFTFYTNYNSQKGKEITENPFGALLFFWPQLHQQIRIEGVITRIDPAVSANYFNERPRESKVSAWVSPQSSIVENREMLELKYKEFEQQHINKEIPYPGFWGGYCLKPNKFEFWQGHQHRLHDRVLYSINSKNNWDIVQLAP